jgi:ATP-dependent helicase/nuclease subunit A
MIADNPARAQALNTSTSFIVQAPAGSGKTELLIQRFLKLLSIVDSPEAIVAITFTRKAAGEMRARVLEALRKAESGGVVETDHQKLTQEIARQVLERDRALGWNLLRNPAQMRIETIDALCASITRRMPWLARFGAMPEISEKAGDLYRDAARNTLRHVEAGDPALAYLLLHLDNDFMSATRLIVNMLEKRDQWLRLTGVNPDFNAVRIQLERSLEELVLAELRRLHAGFDSEIASEIAVLKGMDCFPSAAIEDLEKWSDVADLLLTASGTLRKGVNKNMGFPPTHPLKIRCEQLLLRMQSHAPLIEALNRYRELPAPRFSDSQWQAMQASVSVLTLAVAELQLVFRETGRVDFPELLIRASRALGNADSPTDLALALGHRIQHILVDEFQDTSYTQFELLEKLTAGWEPGDGRTLFLVGDPMQSVYRFRQADVSLFLRARADGIGALRLEPLTLTVNFRSKKEIVEWVNETFAGILPSEDDVESGAIAYSMSTAAGVATPDSFERRVEVHGFLDPLDEAARVVELVKNSGDRKIAVLVRARPHLVAIVSALKRSKIPFQAVEIDQLSERQVIEDLMALTLALLHPGDRVSWLAVLRAPWCGLTLEDLHSLAAQDHYAAIWDLLRQENLPLTPDGQARIARILPVLQQAIDDRARRPLREWVEHVWLRLGGPACVADETALDDAAAYFDLLEGLDRGSDLTDFSWLRKQVDDLFAQPDAQAGDLLQVMTIHKAKGLEFDTVILPALGSPPRQDDAPLLLWLEQGGQLLLAPISASGTDTDPIYRYLERIERRKAESETARLLYVAATRARTQVHLLASLKTKEDGSIVEPASGSFLKLLWPLVAASFADLRRTEAKEQAIDIRTIHRLPVGWAVPAAPGPVSWTPRGVEILETSPVAFEWVGDRLRYTGTALHGFLQRIAREGLDVWNSQTVRANRPLYRTVLGNLGVPPAEIEQAAADVERGLLETIRDVQGRWILDRHADAECELSVSGLIEGKLYTAMIDRTFIDDDGVRWIIDYKTSEHSGGDLDTFLNNEKERYQEQLGRYARLMFQREDRPIRLGLYFPLLGGWREWAAPVVLSRQASLFEL